MKQWQVLKNVFPEVITDNFEFTDYKESDSVIEYWLDEREYMSGNDYKKGTVSPYSFTELKTVQDFPIRGRSVYLHIRRRKWIDPGEIFTYTYDNLTEADTKISPEFVVFLKEEDETTAENIKGIAAHYGVNRKQEI
ncbi:ISAon1 family transposase N-terminal region protein [Bacteroides sp.]